MTTKIGEYRLPTLTCPRCTEHVFSAVSLDPGDGLGETVWLETRPRTDEPSFKHYIIAAGPGAQPGNFTYVIRYRGLPEDRDEPRFALHRCPRAPSRERTLA